MIHRILASLLLIFMGLLVMADGTPRSRFDFAGENSAKEWQSVNDGVMGGVSEGKFKNFPTKRCWSSSVRRR